MSKQDKSKWTGRELFEYYINLPGSYSGVLMLAYQNINDNLFLMLEECERTGKKIVLKEENGMEGVFDPPLVVKMRKRRNVISKD